MLSEDSRFNYSPKIRVINADGTDHENERVHLPYPREVVVGVTRPDLAEYVVQAGDTWSNIAARFFRGRSDLWWVIAEFTNVLDPFSELVVGKTLKIPRFDTVQFEVLDFDKRVGALATSDLDSL